VRSGLSRAADLGIDDLEHGLLVDTEFLPGKKSGECPEKPENPELISKLDTKAGSLHDMILYLVQHHVAVTSTLPVFEMGSFPGARPCRSGCSTLYRRMRGRRYWREECDPAMPPISEQSMAPKNRLGPRRLRRRWNSNTPSLRPADCCCRAGSNRDGWSNCWLRRSARSGIAGGGWVSLRWKRSILRPPTERSFWESRTALETIAPGKQADLVVIKGDPSKKIEDIENVETVFKDGVGYDSGKLIESVRGVVGSR